MQPPARVAPLQRLIVSRMSSRGSTASIKKSGFILLLSIPFLRSLIAPHSPGWLRRVFPNFPGLSFPILHIRRRLLQWVEKDLVLSPDGPPALNRKF